MFIFTLFLSVILTIFATLVLSYISIATMIGPWIAPTLVLFAGLAFKLFTRKISNAKITQEITLIQTVGSVGGLVATAVGFTLPTLYFLNAQKFAELLVRPWYFCGLIAGICLTAGSFGIFLGKLFAHTLMKNKELTFPVSQLVHKTITSQTQTKQTRHMLAGFFSTSFFCFLRDGISFGSLFSIKKLLPFKEIPILSTWFGNEFALTLAPMYWAIGFIAGPSIALPLVIGMLSKYLVLTPLNNHSSFLPFTLFPTMSIEQLTLAFCSGLILAEVLPGVLKYPITLWNKRQKQTSISATRKKLTLKKITRLVCAHPTSTLQSITALVSCIIFLTYFNFSLPAQIFMAGLTIISTYQICLLGGKIGLVQLGRFTTFVMIPTILLFKLDALQITLLCLFASICAATASDLLFNYKIGQLCSISFDRIRRYQFLGLVVTALVLGGTLWLLFSNLSLGSSELFGQRGMTRALLIQSPNFNLTVVTIGFFFGSLLKFFSISPSMVFGGLIMQNSLTIGLAIGAIGAHFARQRKEHFPLFSGIFASESLWLIGNILAKML